MASEALVQLGLGEHVHGWLDGYIGKASGSSPMPTGTRLTDRDWRGVLAQWWPILPAGAPSFFRGGRGRALSAVETPPRVAELGQALGYWAARYQPVAGVAQPAGRLTPVQALTAVPRVPDQSGGVSARISQLAHTSGWTQATAALQPPASTADVPDALAALTDAGVARYLSHGHGDAVLLVHAATAPNAAMLAIQALPEHLWLQTHTAIWHVCAAITAGFAPAETWSGRPATPAGSAEEAARQALDNGDEHIIKFTETALQAERRGLAAGRAAAAHALQIIPADG